MIFALLLAVAVAGQIADTPKGSGSAVLFPIDTRYRPKVNDHATLGVHSSSAASAIGTANCYSSAESVCRYAAFLERGDAEDGNVSDEPEGYVVRAATRVVVKEMQVLKVLDKNYTVVKVEILDGEFKGKQLYASVFDVYRYIGETESAPKIDAIPQVKATPKKRSNRRGTPTAVPPDAKLVLTDLTVNPSAFGSSMNVNGRVRCESDVPIRTIMVTVSFEDQAGRLVRSVEGFCMPLGLSKGEIGAIEVPVPGDVRYARLKLNFKDLEKNISWFDQTGMNAHN
jgi:hypothetical protein